MLVSDLIDRIRNKIGEVQTNGAYDTDSLVEAIGDALNGMLIPDLYRESGLTLMNGLIANSSALSLSDSDPYTYDLSSESDNVFIPSLKAWVDGLRVEIMDLDDIPEYKNDTLAYFRPKKLGTIVGLELRIYDTISDVDTLALDYVKITDYGILDTIELDDSVILGLLLWSSCYTAVEGDPAFEANDKTMFLNMYRSNLNTFTGSSKTVLNPPPIPVIRQRGEQEEEIQEARR